MPKLEVFVSHRTVEAMFVDLLRTRLEQDFIGIINFFISTDITSVPAGSQWYAKILEGLRRAHLLLVVCSNESVKLPWISYETGGALARGVDVVALCHSGMTPDHLPPQLEMLEGVMLADATGLAKVYAKISEMIGCDIPKVNFAALGQEFKRLEEKHAIQLRQEAAASQRQDRDSVIDNPRVMCVTSDQYLEMGLANELQTVLDAFPRDLRHSVIKTSQDLDQILSTQQVDVVHIAAFVCPRSGTLYFNRVELPLGRSSAGPEDFIRAEALVVLLKKAGTRLVVIASGDSLALATDLLPLANVIAPRDMITARSMATWVRTFYTSLKTKTLMEAAEFAEAQSRASMKLLTQQVASSMKIVLKEGMESPAAATGVEYERT